MTAWRRVVNSGAGVGAGAGGKLARCPGRDTCRYQHHGARHTSTSYNHLQCQGDILQSNIPSIIHGIYTTQVLIELIE